MSPLRLRLRYSKLGKVRFTSHRDVARIWERSLRRVGLPIAYTEGFSPRPKLSFGLALSVGYESLGEYLDVALRDDASLPDPEDVPAQLAPGLPEGITAQIAVPLPPGSPSLQQSVTSCTWHIDVAGGGPSAVAGRLADALAATELPLTRERKGRAVTDDIRPAIVSARVLGPAPNGRDPAARIEAELVAAPRALRPTELVAAIIPRESAWHVGQATRIHQWTLAGGARREVIPLPSAATPPPHAEVRAS